MDVIRARRSLAKIVINGVIAWPLVPVRVRWRLLNLAGLSLEPSLIGQKVYFGGPDVRIGEGSGINIGCVFDNLAPITLGRNVAIGHQVLLLTSTHEPGTDRPAGPATGRPIVIEDGAWIGARAIVMPGVTIGAGCTVGAGAVVTKDCLPGATYAGVPARMIKGPPAVVPSPAAPSDDVVPTVVLPPR